MWKYLEKISKKSITFMLIAPTNILLKPNSRRTNGYGYQQHSLDFSYCPPPPVRSSVHVCAFSDSREMKWRKLWRSVHGRRCCVPRTKPPPQPEYSFLFHNTLWGCISISSQIVSYSLYYSQKFSGTLHYTAITTTPRTTYIHFNAGFHTNFSDPTTTAAASCVYFKLLPLSYILPFMFIAPFKETTVSWLNGWTEDTMD